MAISVDERCPLTAHQIDRTLRPDAAESTIHYRYAAAGDLAAASVTEGVVVKIEAFTYDAAGNQLVHTYPGSYIGTATETRSYDCWP